MLRVCGNPIAMLIYLVGTNRAKSCLLDIADLRYHAMQCAWDPFHCNNRLTSSMIGALECNAESNARINYLGLQQPPAQPPAQLPQPRRLPPGRRG